MKIYGSYNSSAGRCYVMLEECQLKYERIPLEMKEKQHKSPDYLKLNPNGKVPTLIDGDFVLWESISINKYLAEKYRPELLGGNIQERALVDQWSTWSIVELQPPLVDLLIQKFFVPMEHQNQAIIKSANEKYPRFLKVLDQHLTNKDYMVGTQFTLADLNVACTVNVAYGLGMNLSEYKNITAWMSKMKTRPSFQKVAELSKH